VGHVEHLEDVRKSYKIIVWKTEGERLRGRHKQKCVDNIKMNLKETAC
jgi:hypothetical protein